MPIPMEITFRGLAATASIEDRIRRWADKLETIHDRILGCQVAVEVPHRRRERPHYHVRIRLAVPGEELVVSHDPGRGEAHEDVYVAIHDSFRAARRKLEDNVRRNARCDVKTHMPG